MGRQDPDRLVHRWHAHDHWPRRTQSNHWLAPSWLPGRRTAPGFTSRASRLRQDGKKQRCDFFPQASETNLVHVITLGKEKQWLTRKPMALPLQVLRDGPVRRRKGAWGSSAKRAAGSAGASPFPAAIFSVSRGASGP